jgi:uncharacterized membrane protein YeaQ/YmgE (transglycosylase-associated protein family)
MGLLLWIVLGALAGWIASTITRTSYGTFGDILLGVLGAIIGGFVMSLFGLPGVTGFNIWSVVVAVVGASLAIYIGRMVRRA